MTIIAFPSATHPTTQDVLATTSSLASRFPSWRLEMDVAEDGRPSVAASHRSAGGFMSAHWAPGGWVVLDEELAMVVKPTRDLSAALAAALG